MTNWTVVNKALGEQGDILQIALTAGLGTGTATNTPMWASVYGYAYASCSVNQATNVVSVDLSSLGALAPSTVNVYVAWANKPWSVGVG